MIVRRSFTGPTCDFHGIVEDWTDTGDQAMGRLPSHPGHRANWLGRAKALRGNESTGI
jgi:hypothetical protein